MRPQPAGEVEIAVHKLRELSLIIVRGELDLTNIHLLGDAVDHVVGREVPVLFDLTKVHYIDSTGLRFMRRVHDQCALKRLPFAVVTNINVRRFCGLLSLETIIPMFPDSTAARDHIVAEWGRPASGARVFS